MKKYIFILVFLGGLLFNFYLGYNSCIGESQNLLVETAVKSNDYEFFLKFHSYYDSTADYESENVLVNKIYLSDYDQVGYNLIIKNLKSDDLVQTEEENQMCIVLTGEDGSYSIEYTATAYLYLDIINLQISKNDILDNCGSEITSIEVYNPDGKVIVNNNTSIDTNELVKENVIDKEQGYTTEETKELLKIASYQPLLTQVGGYLLFSLVVLCVSLVVIFIKNRRLNRM